MKVCSSVRPLSFAGARAPIQAVMTRSSSTGSIGSPSDQAACPSPQYPGYELVARLPSRRREIYHALEDRPPWRRVALAVGHVAVIAEALRRLDHPGIVRLIADHGDAVALSWVPGRRLDRAARALSGDERLDVAIQVAEIVAHAHERGVVLRDVKPGNLLLAADRVVLVDLDLAMCDGAPPGEHESGGTWGWSAPEQAILEPAQIDLRADLYALGTTLYFLFAGEALFSRGAAGVREQFVEDRFSERADRVPARVAPILRTLLQLERGARTMSASEVAAALRALAGEPVRVAPASRQPAALRGGARPQPTGVARSAAASRSAVAPRSAADGAAAAARSARIGDLAAAAMHARAALAIDPAHVGALTWLARTHLATDDHAAAHRVVDQLEAALDASVEEEALEAALALEVTLMRPARGLALALRTRRTGALATLADRCDEWLKRASRLAWHERAARAARGRGADEIGEVLAVRGTALLALVRRGDSTHGPALAECMARLSEAPGTRGHGCALAILERIHRGDGDGDGAAEALQRALLDGTLAPPQARVLYRAPLADALAHGAAAIGLCEAMLLALVGLDHDATTVALSPLDAARVALATGRREDALALVASVPPGEVADQIRALAAGDVDALRAAHQAHATWESAYWLCHALVMTGRAAECVPIVDAVWLREGPDPILAELRAAGVAAEPPDPAEDLRRGSRDAAATALADQDWEALYQAGAVALALDRGDAEARAQLALASLERGEVANAHAFAKQAVAMRADCDVAWDLIIRSERELGARDPLATVRAALRECPTSARLACRFAEALAAAGDHDEALAASEQAVRLGPDDRTTWATHAGLLLDADRPVDAIHLAASFEQACGPGHDVHAIRLRAWLQCGEPERAVAAGLAGVAADAAQPFLWRNLALAWIDLDRFADARNALAMIGRCGAADPALAYYLDLTGEATAWLAALRDPAFASSPDLDLVFVGAIARLAIDGAQASRSALRSVHAVDHAPGFAARIALRHIADPLAARVEAALADQLADAPRELGWAGARYFLARGQAATAAAFAARALVLASDVALWRIAAEAAILAGDDALAAQAMPHVGDRPAARLARRLRRADTHDTGRDSP